MGGNMVERGPESPESKTMGSSLCLRLGTVVTALLLLALIRFNLRLGTAVTTALFLVLIRLLHQRRLRLPPGPRPWPIVGNLPHISGKKKTHIALQELSEKYGPVMFLKLGSIPTVIISSPEMAKEFLISQGELFASRPDALSSNILSFERQNLSSSSHLPLVYLLRRICAFELLSTRRVQEYKDVRTEEIMTTVQTIMEEGKDGKPVHDIVYKFVAANNNAITRILFKKSFCDLNVDKSKVAGDAREFQDLALSTADMVTEFFLGNYLPFLNVLDPRGLKARMWKARNRWDEFLGTIIKQHIAHRNEGLNLETERRDIVDILLSGPEKEKLSAKNIKGLLKDLILGGTDTSANQTAWGIVDLVRNPDKQKKLQEELDTVVGRGRLVDESDIPKLPYLQAFVNECFRRRPILPLLIPHESINLNPVTVAGFEIPPKTRLMVNVYAIQMDPNLWPDPMKFEPERFLNKPTQVKGQDFGVLPFGTGRRICPGMNLGILMVQISLAQLAHAFEWSLPEDIDPAVLDDAGNSRTVMGPKSFPLKVSPRLPLELYKKV